MKLEVISNQVDVSSLKEFISMHNGCSNMKKNSVFAIQTGISGEQEFLESIKEADRTLLDTDKGAKSWYLRTGILDSFIDNNKKEEYISLAEQWQKSKDTQDVMDIKLPFEFENGLWNTTYKQAFKQVVTEYMEQETNQSRVKNFMVILFLRIEVYFPKLFKNTKILSKFPKMIYTGYVKNNEYYFFRLLTLCGGDVYCIQPELTLEIKAGNPQRDAQIIKKENPVKCRIPEYNAEEIEREINKIQKPVNMPENIPVNMPANHPQPVQSTETGPREPERVSIEKQRGLGNTTSGVDITRPPRRNNVPETSASTVRRELSYEELAGLASSIVMIRVYDEYNKPFATGSGVLINQEGYILTNFHVVRGAAAYGVCLEGEEEPRVTTELIKYHPENDLALIRIEPVNRRPIPVYQGADLVRGQKVVAIGSPLGLLNTVSDGIIAGFRNISEMSMIQHTAPTSPGSSGGALLNMYGELVGIVQGGFDDGQNLNLAVDHKTVTGFLRGFV